MKAARTGPQAMLIRLAIRFRGIVIALALVLLGSGFYSLLQAKYDVFPEFAPPQVSIQTEAPGLTPEQVELLVTRPVETAINGVPGVKTLRSTSIQGLSIVNVFFDSSSSIYRNRQVVAERLALAAQQLPQGVQPPTMTPLQSSTGIVLVVGLTSEKHTLMELRSIAQGAVRLRLLAVPGIANVAVFGGDIRSIQVQVHPDRLIKYGLTINDVVEAARRATAIRGAGFIDTPNQRVVFQADGQSSGAGAIARTALLTSGAATLVLGDVADVVEAPEPAISGAAIQGKPGVILNVSSQFGANTIEVTKAVEQALEELRPGLARQEITLHTDLFRPANFITTATDNIGTSLLIGGALVIAVLFLFLFDLRTAAISCIAIPLSLLAAIIVLNRYGITLNTMTLGGLAIAVGEVVDDAVIGVENIARRLRENLRLGQPRTDALVIFEACFEVRSAVAYATFAAILVFVPIIILPGLAGRLFAPLGIAYVLAVLASLAVALTVTPALAMTLLAGRAGRQHDPPAVRWSRSQYQSLLYRVIDRPRLMVLATFCVTAVTLCTLPLFETSFLPELREGHFTLHMSAVPGTSIEESLRLGERVAAALRRLPAVRSVAQRVGRAELADDTWGPNYSEFEVDLVPGLSGEESEQAESDIRRSLAGFVGVNFALKTFLSERIEETVSGYSSAVAVNVFGNDLDVLDRKGREIARLLEAIPGASEVQVQSPPGLPQLTIRLRKPDLERWGLDPVTVLDLVRTAYQGDVVGQVYGDNQVNNVITILDQASREDLARVGELPILTPNGTHITLAQVAQVYEDSGRYQVLHQATRRMQTITANVAGRSVGDYVREAKARINAEVALPAGTYVSIVSTADAQSQSQHDLILNALIVGAGVLLLLSVVTRFWRNLVLVVVNLPFALVGGVLAVLATGGVLTLGSMVGFVTLFGITLRNSMMMLSHYQHLIEEEGMSWGLESAVKGATDRLVPILMTSLVTALGLLPLAIGMDDPGREVEGPMAVVILGGLLTSMTLNLLILPTLALRYGRFEATRDVFAVA